MWSLFLALKAVINTLKGGIEHWSLTLFHGEFGFSVGSLGISSFEFIKLFLFQYFKISS